MSTYTDIDTYQSPMVGFYTYIFVGYMYYRYVNLQRKNDLTRFWKSQECENGENIINMAYILYWTQEVNNFIKCSFIVYVLPHRYHIKFADSFLYSIEMLWAHVIFI